MLDHDRLIKNKGIKVYLMRLLFIIWNRFLKKKLGQLTKMIELSNKEMTKLGD